jgi:hypothetical protein
MEAGRKFDGHMVGNNYADTEPEPNRVLRAILAITFIGFIIALPTIIEKVGK